MKEPNTTRVPDDQLAIVIMSIKHGLLPMSNVADAFAKRYPVGTPPEVHAAVTIPVPFPYFMTMMTYLTHQFGDEVNAEIMAKRAAEERKVEAVAANEVEG